MAITCTYPVSPYPPPPIPQFPFGAGNGCLVASYHCECQSGTPVWVNDTANCVSNAACTGAATCSASVYSFEGIGLCTGGVPNVPVTPPPQGTPPCNPTCCAPTGCCARTEYRCQCVEGISSWLPIHAAECVPNQQCDPATNNESTGQHYLKEILNSCPCGVSSTPENVVGRLAADCCAICTYVYTAQCFNNGQGWQISAPDPIDCGPCNPTTWTPAGSCTQTQVTCGGSCSTANGIADCQTMAAIEAAPLPDSPEPPGPLPACCQNLNGNGGCGAAWRSTCTGGTWQTPVLQPTGITGGANPTCVDNCGDYAFDWEGSGCTMTKVDCTGSSCLPGQPCSASPPAVPSSIPSCCAGGPCLAGSPCKAATQPSASVSGVGFGPMAIPWFAFQGGFEYTWKIGPPTNQIIVFINCNFDGTINIQVFFETGVLTTTGYQTTLPVGQTTLTCVGGHVTGTVVLPLAFNNCAPNACYTPPFVAPATMTVTFGP
jgi:hypothetical protein